MTHQTSARDELRRYVRLLGDWWTPPATTEERVERLYAAVRAEVLGEAAEDVARLLADEPRDDRAFALYDALTHLRTKLPCTCARSQGLHETQCDRYVPGHDLASPTRQLARAREELRLPAAH